MICCSWFETSLSETVIPRSSASPRTQRAAAGRTSPSRAAPGTGGRTAAGPSFRPCLAAACLQRASGTPPSGSCRPARPGPRRRRPRGRSGCRSPARSRRPRRARPGTRPATHRHDDAPVVRDSRAQEGGSITTRRYAPLSSRRFGCGSGGDGLRQRLGRCLRQLEHRGQAGLGLVGDPQRRASSLATRTSPPGPARAGARPRRSRARPGSPKPPAAELDAAGARPRRARSGPAAASSRFSTGCGSGPKRSRSSSRIARSSPGSRAAAIAPVDVDLRRLEGDVVGRQVGVDGDVEAHRPRRAPAPSSAARSASHRLVDHLAVELEADRGDVARLLVAEQVAGAADARGRASRSRSRSRARCGRRGSRGGPPPPRLSASAEG